MKLFCILQLCSAACAEDDFDGEVRLEYQRVRSSDAVPNDWIAGDVIAILDSPLPLPLAVRVRVVDERGSDYGLADASLSMYGETQLEILDGSPMCQYSLPDQAAVYCTYDLRILRVGPSVLSIKARAPSSPSRAACMYFSLVPPGADVAAARAELDTRKADCLSASN